MEYIATLGYGFTAGLFDIFAENVETGLSGNKVVGPLIDIEPSLDITIDNMSAEFTLEDLTRPYVVSGAIDLAD